MRTPLLILPAAFLVIQANAADESAWKKQVVTTDFLTEGISIGDLDGDGVKDLVAGAYWFQGPDFKKRIAFRVGEALPKTVYQEDSFLSWVQDFDGDGKKDVLMMSHPGKNLTLYLNTGKDGLWPVHVVMTEAATESPIWVDLDGDGKNEMVCMQGGKFGYAKVDWKDVTKPWAFTAISDKRTNTPYIHGLGAGDLNGDGKPDVLAKDGWFEQPAAESGEWVWHPVNFAEAGGSQMLVFDVDGDGDKDVVTSLDGHGYGLSWYENVPVDGKVTFQAHEILPQDPSKTGVGGLQFSQLHSLAMRDFDGDGRVDFVTGKRYYAHNEHDPGSDDPALLVIFHNRQNGKEVRWEPEVIDRDSGVGCQVQAEDINGDRKLDIIVGNKKGVTVMTR